MDVLVVRHAIAMDREEAGQRGILDADRPLTRHGRARMKKVARGLVARAEDVTAIVSSPLLRATETAEILGRAYGLSKAVTPALLPDAPSSELIDYLVESERGPVAVVGHEPHLSRFASFCLSGRDERFVELRKGGACRIAFDGAPEPGRGRLVWLAPPSFLRRLGRG